MIDTQIQKDDAEGLSDLQLAALAALLEGPSPTDAAARRVGCSPRTLFRYLQEPTFTGGSLKLACYVV